MFRKGSPAPVTVEPAKIFDCELDDVDIEARFENGGLTTDTIKATFLHDDPPAKRDERGFVHVTHFGNFNLASGTSKVRTMLRASAEQGLFYIGDVHMPWSRVLWVKIVKRRTVRVTVPWIRCDACIAGRCIAAEG